MGKLTDAQMKALRFIKKRDYPAGEPRASWLLSSTLKVLKRSGLVVERPNTAMTEYFQRTNIVDLTEAGRTALSKDQANVG